MQRRSLSLASELPSPKPPWQYVIGSERLPTQVGYLSAVRSAIGNPLNRFESATESRHRRRHCKSQEPGLASRREGRVSCRRLWLLGPPSHSASNGGTSRPASADRLA